MHDATWPFYRNRYRKTLPPVPVSFRLLTVNLPLVTVKVGKIASCNGLPLFFLPKPVSGGKPQYGKNSETGMPVVTALDSLIATNQTHLLHKSKCHPLLHRWIFHPPWIFSNLFMSLVGDLLHGNILEIIHSFAQSLVWNSQLYAHCQCQTVLFVFMFSGCRANRNEQLFSHSLL